MTYRVCAACGRSYQTFGPGRPPTRCPDCRAGDRYGPVHQRLRADADQAVGASCSRCGEPILAGQEVSPDHVDGGGPTEYAGYAHRRCNVSAGVSYGNRLRAAAYRAARGLPEPSTAPGNGTAVGVVDLEHQCDPAGCHADGERCACGLHSRAW